MELREVKLAEVKPAMELNYDYIMNTADKMKLPPDIDYMKIPDEEYIAIREECRIKSKELGIPFVQKDYEISLIKSKGILLPAIAYADEKSNVVDYKITRPCRSWVRNLYNAAFGTISYTSVGSSYGTGSTYCKDTSDVACVGKLAPTSSMYNCAAASAAYGIVVGSGVTAWSFSNSKLATIIATGTASGQLYYSDTIIITPTYTLVGGVTETWSQPIIRFFENYTVDSGTVSINEFGLYGNVVNAFPVSGNVKYVMFLREVLGATVSVTYRSILRVKITTTGGFS
jgi:hypothetical protein